MTSLRKRVTSYFRQLSFHNEPRERKTNVNENSFITRYLTGQIKIKDGPPVLYGKSPNDLPNFELGSYSTETDSVVGCSTGPNGGLTTVKRVEKHLSITDPDIDFIDTQDETAEPKHKSPVPLRNKRPLDNSTMIIKVAGQSYQVSNRKSRSLGSLTDLTSTAVDDGQNMHTEAANNNNETSESCKNKNPINCDAVTSSKDDSAVTNSDGVNKIYSLSKSKSECNPFEHRKKGKIIRLSQRPNAQGSQDDTQNSGNMSQGDDSASLPGQWNRKTDFVYGLSDSLYDANQVTKCKNGNPIADCFGIIARNDSAILALADGVNWGEKACIAAKSAIHGCLHYLNKTIFEDTSLFEFSHLSCASPTENSPINTSFTPPPNLSANKRKVDDSHPDSPTKLNENRVSNTTEVFVCLLRAFNCAHNLILENQGMLTTLTVAVVLPMKSNNCKKPLKQEDSASSVQSDKTHVAGGLEGKKPIIRPVRSVDSTKSNPETSLERNINDRSDEKYICCVCNVGDTLAYVYSPKYGVRELTKGSHDVHSNRDMRDALGALGPVDGINPELNNLTLSVTTLDAGDIVMIASDGLTDNYDPTVCKYTVNSVTNEHSKPSRQSHHPPQSSREKSATPRSSTSSSRDPRPVRERKSSVTSRNQTPPRPVAPSNVTRLVQQPSTSDTKAKPQPSTLQSDSATSRNKENKLKSTSGNADNPLIAQFMADNGFENKKSISETKNAGNKSSHSSNKRTNAKSKRVNVTNVLSENKLNPLSKSSSASGVFKMKSVANESTSKYNFLRSKTSVDLAPPRPIIHRNEDGLPYVTPIQKYELTLLLIEDILKRGISGKERQCTTAKSLCENLLRYTISITAAKRRTLEDVDLYFDNKNDILVEISQKEKKIRRKRCLEKVQNLPGKLDHVSIVAYNIGNTSVKYLE